MAATLAAAPAFAERDAEGDRGRSEQARENAPGQEQRQDAGNPDPGNGQGNPPAHAGGPAAQSPPPGHAEPGGRPARPSKTAPRPAKSKPARPARPAGPAKPARPARPVHDPAEPANPHAKAGKTTICHATGSATNPYVTITISDNALPAHARHQDGHDLIPAPAGGCPTAAAEVETGAGAIDEHPARAGKNATIAGPAASVVRGFVGASAEDLPAGGILGVVAEGGAPRVLPPLSDTIAEASRVTRRESGAPVARQASGGQLPFTGLEAGLIALFGALLVLIGALLRRVSGNARTA